MSQRNGIGASVILAVLVFAGGAGMGFAWRPGWLPVEVVPADTGVLDDAGVPTEPNAVMPQLPMSPLALSPTNDAPHVTAPEHNVVSQGIERVAFQEPPRESAPKAVPAAPASDFDAVLAEADQLLDDGDTLAAHK